MVSTQRMKDGILLALVFTFSLASPLLGEVTFLNNMGAGNGQIFSPTGVAVSKTGEVIVTDLLGGTSHGGRILKFNGHGDADTHANRTLDPADRKRRAAAC